MLTNEWRTSSRSNSQPNGDCVEVRLHDGTVQVRDTKLGADSPILDASPSHWLALLRTEGRNL